MEWMIMLLNFAYAVLGAIVTLLAMTIGYWVFDRMTPFDTGASLRDGNTAVGIVIAGIFIGLGIAMGLVIGLGLN